MMQALAKTPREMKILSEVATFQSEGRLLQELGERLVSKPEVALVELIKNAFDADSSYCTVSYDNQDSTISVSDDGNGMTEDDFKNKWMRVASSSKSLKTISPRFRRKVTGEKGIGRFAVRFLGKSLSLETVANDQERNCTTKLRAFFDWEKVDQATDLAKVKIAYELWEVPKDTQTGTILAINSLRISAAEIESEEIRTKVLRTVSPFGGLDRGRFPVLGAKTNVDPGFNVNLPNDEADRPNLGNLSSYVLDNHAGRVSIDLDGRDLTITASVPGWKKGTRKIVRDNFKHNIRSGFVADIRYFPQRPGTFQAKGIDGKSAWKWVRENAGVAIIDYGLRIKPFGEEEDDWLSQDRDSASNYRKWRSKLMSEEFDQPDSDPSTNPMLYLPQKRQVVGAVFLESSPKGTVGLIPSADREGYLANEAFDTVVDIVRAGIELLALVDKKNQQRLEIIEADKIGKAAQAGFKAAITRIQSSPTLAPEDKARIVTEYKRLSENLTEAKEYARKAAFNLEAMSLLGVVAGFMTHESRRIMRLLDNAVGTLQNAVKKGLKFETDLEELQASRDEFKRHLDYTSTFINNVNGGMSETIFKVKPQIEDIVSKFYHFAHSRNIEVKVVANDDCKSPKISVGIYTGVILNLYTNAIKAVIARQQKSGSGRIEIRAWNEKDHHIVEVVDNGVGIPEEIKERIWDPLFTTTSSSYNPLGSGMGLGLSLVKRLIEEIEGKIFLVTPPQGFNTCFEIRYPLNTKK
jgi:signal transduction histidine kinase